MAKQKGPIKQRPAVEKDSIVDARERHGKHRQDDESHPGKGGKKGGLNRQSGAGTLGTRQNTGLPKGHSGKPRGSRGRG